VSIHQLIQQAIHYCLTKKGENSDYLIKGILALYNVYPYDKDQILDLDLKRTLKPHYEKGLKFLDTYLESLFLLDNEEAKRWLLKLQKNILMPVLIYLADACDDLGDVRKKKELLERLLKFKEINYGKDHIETAITLNNLANAYGTIGHISKKIELLERALKIQELHYGKNHADVAITLVNLANAYGNLGNAKKKIELLERALEIDETKNDNQHVSVAIDLHNLANAYGDLGNAKKKKELLKRALKIQESHYGKNHVDVARILTDLGDAYCRLRDMSESEKSSKRALEIMEKHYGNNHVEVAKILVNLSNVYLFIRETKKQIDLLERALIIFQNNYDQNHFDVATTLSNLGNAHFIQGKIDIAKQELERALDIYQNCYGEDHVEVARVLRDLAKVYDKLGNAEEKRDLLQQALIIQKNHYGQEHSEVASTLLLLGVHNYRQENLIEAKHYVQMANDIFTKLASRGEDHLLQQHAKYTLEMINKDLKMLQKEEYISGNLFTGLSAKPAAISYEFLNRSIVSLYRKQVEANPENWQAWLQLADQYYGQGNLEQAIQCYSNVIVLSPDNPTAHHNLACLYHVQGNVSLAEQHFEKVLTIKSSAAIFCDYGFLLLKQKRYEEAAKNFLIAICMGNDGSGLIYNKLEKKLLDKYLTQEVTNDSFLEIEPFFIAHYWLIQCFLLLKDNELKEFYLNKLITLSQQYPSALHYRILSYAYKIVGNTVKADESLALALASQSDVLVNLEKFQSFNFKEHYLNNLSTLIERSPSALRYRLLSHICSKIGNEEKAQEYMALAMSLEPMLESQTAQQIVTSERTSNYNPTLFSGNIATISTMENPSQQKFSALEVLLRKAKITPRTLQNKEMVECKFIDHKLVQQFVDELHKFGISNLSMKDGPRKPSIIIGNEGNDDEYIITLTADEYNKIMRDKDAYAKLVRNLSAQSQLSFTS
jgi:tetratricopeptide (TPR) repeat protein